MLFIKNEIDKLAAKEGVFLDLELRDTNQQLIDQNIYWLPDKQNNFAGLQNMQPSKLLATAKYLQPGKVEVTLTNDKQNVPAFFNRVSLTDGETNTRLLPVFYSDNYVTVLPGEQKKVIIDCDDFKGRAAKVSINGWNTPLTYIDIEK